MDDKPDNLNQFLERCCQHCKDKGYPFVVIIDGLDHVWRERSKHGGEQMDHLFSQLLPLPDNLVLALGTQRVPDSHFPQRLHAHIAPNDWFEIPPMDKTAVRRWLHIHADAGRLLIPEWVQNADTQDRWLNELTNAFVEISGGHPLHLMYSLESLVYQGKPIQAKDVENLPICPDGDISMYYGRLWAKLSALAKELLHLFAASDFYWPPNGMIECLGDDDPNFITAWEEIRHLLQMRRTAILPFHGSVLVYIQNLPDHETAKPRLLPKIIDWLNTKAPEYWRWGWLWLTKANTDDDSDLLKGPSRQWMIESLCKGYPVKQIQKIIVRSEHVALKSEAYPRLIELRSLEIRLLNGIKYNTERFSDFQECALSLTDDPVALDFKADELSSLEGDELVSVTRLLHIKRLELPEQALRIAKQHFEFEREFKSHYSSDLASDAETILQIVAYANTRPPKIPVDFANLFERDSQMLFSAYLQELLKVRQVERIFDLWKVPDLPPEFSRLLALACYRIACLEGVRLDIHPNGESALKSPFGAVWNHVIIGKPIPVALLALPTQPVIKYDFYQDQSNFCNYVHYIFFTNIATAIFAQGDFSFISTPLPERGGKWLSQGFKWLENKARQIAETFKTSQIVDIAVLCQELESIQGLKPRNDYDEITSFNLFCRSLLTIAVDLHMISIAKKQASPVGEKQMDILCKSSIWNPELILAELLKRDPALLSQKAASHLTEIIRGALEGTITTMDERSNDYLDLTQFAVQHNLQLEAREFLSRAANCLTGYGHRKDSAVRVIVISGVWN